jgi:hypothetical protein
MWESTRYKVWHKLKVTHGKQNVESTEDNIKMDLKIGREYAEWIRQAEGRVVTRATVNTIPTLGSVNGGNCSMKLIRCKNS